MYVFWFGFFFNNPKWNEESPGKFTTWKILLQGGWNNFEIQPNSPVALRNTVKWELGSAGLTVGLNDLSSQL